jgi:long-chain acyl-CoA synthetase
LPSAHIFEAALFSITMINGLRCGYYSGNVLKLISDDLPKLKPTFFPSVPRLFNKIYAKVKAGVDA